MITIYFIFWISIFLLFYPYTVYPLVLSIFSRFRKNLPDFETADKNQPTVTFIISAHNEGAVIEQKLHNTLGLSYPADKLEILVVSDASTDGTDDWVTQWANKNPRIHLIRQNQRRGKSLGLNLAVAQASSEVVVFSDANAIYEKNSIKELVKHFYDPRVGYVMGAALYNEGRDSSAKSEGLYWQFELFIKKLETRFYSVVGGDGAIYAIRKELYWDLEEDDINDFVNPLQIIAKGYRGVFNPKAICFEDAAGDFKKEFKRKRRIVNRSWRAVKKYISWFNLIKHFKFLFELFSHKIIRWFSLVVFGAAFIANAVIIIAAPTLFYVAAFASQLLFVILTCVGIYFYKSGREMPKLIYLTFYYSLAHAAALSGIIDEAMGVKHITWETVRD